MTLTEIFDAVITNGSTDFQFVADVLARHRAAWCVIGGLAVNCYADPVYTVDADMVVVGWELEPVVADLMAADFRIKRFPFSVNAQRRGGSRLMVQFTLPERYQGFVERAVRRPVFGLDVPVASLADLVQGKLWAWGDPLRRESKRSKDESDLLRLAEQHPEIEAALPETLRARLTAQRARGDDPDGFGDESDA